LFYNLGLAKSQVLKDSQEMRQNQWWNNWWLQSNLQLWVYSLMSPNKVLSFAWGLTFEAGNIWQIKQKTVGRSIFNIKTITQPVKLSL